jgi:predicted transposase YdaD
MREISTYFEQRTQLSDNEWQAIVLFLDMADDPGFGTLAALANQSPRRLVAADLRQLLKQLDEKAVILNVLRPLVVDSELEVRYNVTTWTEYIQQAPDLSQEVKQRLVAILVQLIAQKFVNLTNKEISQILRLTPLEETAAGKEILQNDRVKMLMELIQLKFSLSVETAEAINENLSKLSLETLEDLFRAILKLETVEQLESWLDEHLSQAN